MKKKKLVIELSSEVKETQADSMLPIYPGARGSGGGSTVPALREAKLIKDSHFARLWKYLYEPHKLVELTDFEEDMRKRLANVWQLLTGKILNDRKAVLAHITWCRDNCIDIAERTAYDDLRRAKALYGDPRVNAAVFEKQRISTILLEQLEQMKIVQETGNSIDKIEAAKAINQLTRRYNAVNGLEDAIKTQIPREAHTIIFNADPDTLKEQAKELMKGVAIDTEYEEVK